MAILYGTTGDGTTLPVLVDQFGNLLAKGIDGEQGPPGQPGEQGPPGAGQLPAGEDGQYLQLVNGSPAWVDLDVGPTLRWSDYVKDATGALGSVSSAKLGFDGLASTYAQTSGSSQIIWSPPFEIQCLSVEASISFLSDKPSWKFETETAGIYQSFNGGKAADEFYFFNRLAGVTIGPTTPLVFYTKDSSNQMAASCFSRIKINGNVIMDYKPIRAARIIGGLTGRNG